VRKRRWPRLVFVALALTCCIIALLPQIVAWSPLRHELPRFRLKGFRGAIRVGSASLSWQGPNVLSDVELDAPDGKPFFRVRMLTENRGVWSTLFHRKALLETVMEEPFVDLVLRADGSNVEDALAPVLANQAHLRRKRITKIVGGQLRITESATGTTNALQNVAGEVQTDLAEGAVNHVALTAEEADSATRGKLEVSAAWSSRSAQNPPARVALRDLSLRIENASLARTQALAHRFWPDLEIAGTATGHIKAEGDLVSIEKSVASGEWDLTCRDLRVSSPSRIGADAISPGPTEFRGRFDLAGINCRIDDLHLKTDFCNLQGGFAFLLHETPEMLAATDAATRMPLPELDLHGELDLVALARQAPHTLQIREGTELKEGRIRFDVASRNEPESPRWTGQLTTSRIAAQIGGQEVAWDQPLNLEFGVRRSQGRYEIDRIESQSDVIMLHGSATSSGLHLEAGCDLQELLSRIGRFLNTDTIEAQGTLTAAADFSRNSDGILQVDSRLTLDNLTLRRLVTRMIERRAGEL
jgi:hypothetical protein